MKRLTSAKILGLFLPLLFVCPVSADSAVTNLGSSEPAVFHGNVITPRSDGPRLLYAPSESDDAAYRAAMAAQVGGTCDYYDARFGVPSLANYDGVMTWANYAYFDNVAMGNALANFVDTGGHVVLGAFCAYTPGNYLSGRIMTDTGRYCPVTGGFNHFSLSFWDGSDPSSCAHAGVTSYGCTYRDFLTVVAPHAWIEGHFQDGELANVMNVAGDVAYANGAGGYPLAPEGQDAQRAANYFLCGAHHVGACCLVSGECELHDFSGCESVGGTFMGYYTWCDPGVCSPLSADHTTWGGLKSQLRH